MDDYGPASGRPRAADTGVRAALRKEAIEARGDLVWSVKITRRWRRDDGTVMVSVDMIRNGEVWDSIWIEHRYAKELAARLVRPTSA